MYAQTACTVADCIAMLLSKKAKLKENTAPEGKPLYQHILTQGPLDGECIRLASLAVCLPFHLLLMFAFQISVSLSAIFLRLFVGSWFIFLSLFFIFCLFVFCTPSLSVCLRICPSLYPICLSATFLPFLSVMSVQQHKKT